MKPHGHVDMSTKVLSLSPGETLTVKLEVYIPSRHQASDKVFLPVPILLYGLKMTTALERLDTPG